MSLLSGLDSHERNPATKWGRYSDHSGASPENDEVCLVTVSPQLNIKRSTRRNVSVATAPQLIEIKDDKFCAKLRSNTDKNPKTFSSMAANFTIPKTKQQTTKNKPKTSPSNNCSETGQWMSANRKSQLPLVSSQSAKRKDLYDDKKPKKVLRQTVNHSETPKTPDTCNRLNTGRNKLARSTYSKESPKFRSSECEEIHCPLCNARLTTGRCLTCPLTASEVEFESSVIENCNKQDLFVRLEDAASSTKPGRAERNFEWKNEESSVEVDVPVSSEFHDEEFHDSDDFIEASPPLEASSKRNMTQNDLFCELCSKGKSKNGCSCSKSPGHSTATFYPRPKKKGSHRYCGIKCGGVKKFTAKRKGSVLNSKAKKNVKNKKVDSKQATIDNSGNTIVDSRKGRKKKDIEPIEPALVHISSDEDETTIDDGANIGNDLNQDTHDKRLAAKTKKLEEVLQVGAAKRTSDELAESSLFSSELDSTSKQPNGISTKQSNRRQKKLDQNVNMFREEDDVLFTVDQVAVGTLCGKAKMPVEVLEGMLIIRMSNGHEVFQFRLQKDDLELLKIHNKDYPWMLIIRPNPGWARKYYERYKSHGIFVDPGSDVYNRKHIILVLHEKLTETAVEKMVKLVDQNFSDEPAVVKITHKEALAWKTVIDSIVEEMEEKPRCSSKNSTSHDPKCKNSTIKKSTSELRSSSIYSNAASQSSLSPAVDSQETKKRAVLATKTYSTRSKSSPRIESPPRSPTRKILDYQPSNRKLDGVRITNEDIRCLKPDIYLNDVIIDFYIKYIIEEKLSIIDRERIHVFGSYFYKVLTRKIHDQQRSPANMHARAKSWTKNVDIFSKDFIVIPVNENSHWFLVIICYPRMVAELSVQTESQNNEEHIVSLDTTQEASEEQTFDDVDDEFDESLIDTARKSRKKLIRKTCRENEGPLTARPCILVFDSLGGSRRNSVVSNLRNYLNYEWKERRDDGVEVTFNKETLKAGYPKIPCQENYTDCGLYVLQYFEKFFTKPVGDYRFPIDLRDDWFSQEEMKTKRDEIVGVIYDLQAKVESGEIR